MPDTTVIQPAPGQAILTTEENHDNHGHRGHYGHGNHDAVESRADYRALTQQTERFGVANGDRINSGVQVTGDRINAVGAAGAAAACRTNELVQGVSCATDRLVQSGFGGVHDRLCDATGKVIHEIDRHGDAAALAACKIGEGIADVKFHGMETAKDQIIAQNVGFSAQSVLSQTIGSAATVLATSIGNQLSNQATANYNGTTVQLERVRAELEAKVAAGFAASTLLAFQNKADSDKQAAECCCELKALITAEGVSTRALANEIEARRTQNELQRLQTQVAILTGGVVGARAA